MIVQLIGIFVFKIKRIGVEFLVRRKEDFQIDSKVNRGDNRRGLLLTLLYLDAIRTRRTDCPINLVLLAFKSGMEKELVHSCSSLLLSQHLLN